MSIIRKLERNLVVSCQAQEGEPLCVPGYMTRMAIAAKEGGAVAIRANGPEDIASIKKEVDLPIIGIWKVPTSDSEVFITPTIEVAREVFKAGADIIGVDATFRKNSEGKWAWEIIREIKEEMDVLVMADISTLEEGINAAKVGADIVGTTLSGYTEYTKDLKNSGPDFKLIKELSSAIDTPVMAEGRIFTIEQVEKAFDCGAYSVTIGSAITRPQEITKYFVKGIENYKQIKSNKALDLIEQYNKAVLKVLNDSLTLQREKIISISENLAERIIEGGIVHLFGTGHSHIIAEDAFYRAGGLAFMNAILEPNLILHNGAILSSWLERVEGLAEQIIKKHKLDKKDSLIIISNSGRNAVPIEMAMEAKKRGIYTVAITSSEYADIKSRHSSGKKLNEVVDDVLDNSVVLGDASVNINEDIFMGAVSTIAGSAIIQALMIEIAYQLNARGIEPPVIRSVNIKNNIDDINEEVIRQYEDRIKF